MNWHLKACLSERIEQKKWTHVRQLIGYDRLGHPARVAALNAVYDDWNLLPNLFCPTMKLKEKRREGGKYRKTYHAAHPPVERLLAWSGLSQEVAQATARPCMPEMRCWLPAHGGSITSSVRLRSPSTYTATSPLAPMHWARPRPPAPLASTAGLMVRLRTRLCGVLAVL